MRVVGYARVSSDEQMASGAGMAAQHDGIAEEAVRRGWDLVAIYEDGASGRSLDGRPGLSAALSAVAAGEADALVVLRLDRLARDLGAFSTILARARREGWALIALDLGVDTSTPAGELVANVLASVAMWERRAIGERTRLALAAKRREGVRLGRPRSVATGVRARIMTERAAGRTFRRIADGLNRDGIATSRGGVRWHPETVRKVWRQEQSAAEASTDL